MAACHPELSWPALESSHALQYGEFRQGYAKDEKDTRVLFYGIRYILETYLHRRWTVEDVEKASLFFKYGLCVARVQYILNARQRKSQCSKIVCL